MATKSWSAIRKVTNTHFTSSLILTSICSMKHQPSEVDVTFSKAVHELGNAIQDKLLCQCTFSQVLAQEFDEFPNSVVVFHCLQTIREV